MKKMRFNLELAAIILFIFSSGLSAQNNDEKSVRSSIVSLLELCKTRSYKGAVQFIAYRGTDKNRDLQTHFNPNDKNEFNQVKRIVNKISALIQLSSKYEIGEIIFLEEGKTVYRNAEIIFISGEQKLTTIFKLVKTNIGYLLYDIN